jgi:protein TonB
LWQGAVAADANLDLRPPWLRAAAFVAVAGFHGAVVGGFGHFRGETHASPGHLEVGVISRGEIAFDAQTVPVPESVAMSALPESASVPDTPQQADKAEPDLPEPALQSEAEAEQTKKQPDTPDAVSPAPPAPPVPATQASAARIGSEGGQSDLPQLSLSRYAAIVSAEINRHKHYPKEARLCDEHGAVGIAFTIEQSGRVISSMVTRSSGSKTLDDAASNMVAAAMLPPPPGGKFRGQILITFRTKE